MKRPMNFKQIVTLLTRKVSLFCLVFAGMLLFSCGEGVVDYAEVPPPVEFSSKIPVDVDPALQEKLKAEKKYDELNTVFNEYSWQAFVAIQWPRDTAGNALPNFTDDGTSTWLGWKEAFQVYRADGQKPACWGCPRDASGLGIHGDLLNDTDSRIVLSSKTPTHTGNFNIADETDQAFAGELYDQNGNLVVYEVLMNEAEFDYVLQNSLYNINGQINYSKKNDTLANFPKGDYANGTIGATEIKFAWKVLEDTDIKERYYRDKGYIEVVKDGKTTLVLKDLGMIGMHISQKTPTGSQWVWSTFEHIDNLDENEVEIDGTVKRIHPTLRDPKCEICPANADITNGSSYNYVDDKNRPYWEVWTKDPAPSTPGGTQDSTSVKYYANYGNTLKTQAFRMVNIPTRVADINAQMQAYFKQQNSVWQYYQLIDTQYPLHQNMQPSPNSEDDYVLAKSVTNKPGGDPNIALLTNITMETFFQSGNQSASNLMEANPDSDINIFGTESCMGCHSSAGISYAPTINSKGKLVGAQGSQLSGDFSWLLGKANWNKDSIPSYPTQKNSIND